jgi:Cu/Ag efflux protein CusF
VEFVTVTTAKPRVSLSGTVIGLRSAQKENMPMPLVKRALALAAILLIALAIPTFAQDGGGGARPQQPAATVASGELVKVDTSAKTITIKTESDPEMVFSYTDATKVTGTKEVAGLATMTGSSLTIRYTKMGEKNVATEIAVQPKKS